MTVKMWLLLTVLIILHLNFVSSSFPKKLEERENFDELSVRSCCRNARSTVCQSGCISFNRTINLNESCRRSDEPEFFFCLEKHQNADTCCGHISNITCKIMCKELFYESEKSSIAKYYRNKANCFNHVPKCLKNIIGTGKIEDPSQYENCCNEADNLECLETCRQILQTASSEKEILDALEVKCRPVKPHSPMWSCLLKLVPSNINQLPLDAGKLSCCAKASRATCEHLCRRTYYTDWQLTWLQFEKDCLSSRMENEMRICLEDADNSCKFGCSGLSFCSTFTKNYFTAFRSCSIKADKAAKREFDNWINGGIVHDLGVFLRAASTCPIETLHILACILHLQPCELQTHETRLCYYDCLEIMSTCVDWSSSFSSSSSTKSHSAESLCSKFSPLSTNPCVSIKSFLKDSYLLKPVALPPEDDIQQPCRTNHCPSDQICFSFQNISVNYGCQPACPLGEMSKQLVTVGSWVQIPRFDQQGCYKICQCTLDGIEKCKILNCFTFKSCWVQDRFISHNTAFFLECNKCRCFMGELTCFRKNCGENRMPALPCNCPAHYVPTCSRLGITYASSCLAKCAGFTTDEIEFGSCSSKDPCMPDPCNQLEKCIRKSRICLSIIHKPCRQYECIPLNCSSANQIWKPVCDRNNRQHDSLCSMMKAGESLGYRGPCLKDCSLHGPVCGINGEIYPNECAAVADKTVVDYFGPCIVVGLISNQAKPRCTDMVSCPALTIPDCIGVTPPGACCPICGGAARLYYSRKQLDRVLYMMDNEQDKDAVTLEAMITALEHRIAQKQCNLRGMVTPDGDILIVNLPTSKNPSILQLRVCLIEIERLSILILQKSPTIMMEVPLSALTGAEVVHTQISNSAFNFNLSAPLFKILFVFLFTNYKID